MEVKANDPDGNDLATCEESRKLRKSQARLFRLHAHDGRLRSLPPELVWRSALRALTPRDTDRSS